jgi:hypothetical protein
VLEALAEEIEEELEDRAKREARLIRNEVAELLPKK